MQESLANSVQIYLSLTIDMELIRFIKLNTWFINGSIMRGPCMNGSDDTF